MKTFVYSGIVLMVILAYVVVSYPDFQPFPQMTALANSRILNFFGYDSVSYKNNVVIDDFNPVRISSECSGIILLLAFVITVHLLPVLSIYHKISSLLLIPVIFIGNIIRILMSIFVGLIFSKDTMIFFHNSASQLFLFFWAIIMYIIWLKVSRLFPVQKFNRRLHRMME